MFTSTVSTLLVLKLCDWCKYAYLNSQALSSWVSCRRTDARSASKVCAYDWDLQAAYDALLMSYELGSQVGEFVVSLTLSLHQCSLCTGRPAQHWLHRVQAGWQHTRHAARHRLLQAPRVLRALTELHQHARDERAPQARARYARYLWQAHVNTQIV